VNGTQEAWVLIIAIIAAGVVLCKWADVMMARRTGREPEEKEEQPL
jgi:hypothetical protein